MNPLHQIMGVTEASGKWGLSPGYIERLCQEGKLQAVRLDQGQGPWVLLKDQPAPQPAVPPRNVPSKPAKTPTGDRGSTMSSRLRDALYE